MSKLNLESRYRPDIAYLSIGIGKRSHGKRGVLAAHRFIVAVTHGFGGGLKPGSSLNRADDYWGSYEGIDVGITGHVHRPTHAYKQKLVIDRRRGTLSTRTDLLVLASSWLDGSTEGYAVRKGYPAVPTCIVQRITLHAPVRTDMPGDIEFSSRSIHASHWDRG